MNYCAKCLIPDTKPYTVFNDKGVCSACVSHEQKQQKTGGINWQIREQEFDKIVKEAKDKKAPYYDCLVPVSGGKDSITQVHRLLKHGVRILAVNVDYGIKTEVGISNLNLIAERMGAALTIYKPEQTLHKQLIKIGFEQFGDPDLLSHTLLHAYPLHTALAYKIPLVVLGENSAFEYGGDTEIANSNSITREWFSKYAANGGRDALFVSRTYGIDYEKLRLYDFPDDLKGSGTKTIFSSYYFFWNSEEHLEIAKSYGFKTLESSREGTYRNYVGIDEKINRIHQYMKVLKFGYGRATDHACEDIRNGRLTRHEAAKLVKLYDTQELSGYYIDDFCAYLQYSKEEFYSILERYRNLSIWKRGRNGVWHLPANDKKFGIQADDCPTEVK
ncbi:MAG: N-acetyl sugar amidotransferase [Nitrospirae bacterium]|nr:N-acetyl sugar amidotransferase [Nitrospirota bacterium]